jgi:NitT/TauT family transport system substrate-binding protein
MRGVQSRRRFLAALSAAGALAMTGPCPAIAEEPPPETTSVRLGKVPGICIAPQYVADDLLAIEGFTDISYVPSEPGTAQAALIAAGEMDFSLNFIAPLLLPMDAGQGLTLLAGVHVGCFELFAREDIRSIGELKGRTVGVQALGSSPHLFLSGMAAYVGLDPTADLIWVTAPAVKPMDMFIAGEIDAFLGFPPEPQALRAQGVGHVVVSSAVDHPWSQYFCCMLAANSAYVEANPIATRRVVRAILKATDICLRQPELVAQKLVDGGFTPRYDYALQALNEVPYGVWRDYDPTDTVRFYALRLHEAGMIRSTPNSLIQAHTDWRFFNEVKSELKG